ncbi:MAG TPA: hypothetical protein VF503_10905 [Sphingobium sp.]|uniref:hypothetical protein n=1 Tax=Sphingobium sp. TaxID=1912891 RepID=UPI002ED412CA
MIWLLALILSCVGTEVFVHLPIARSVARTLASGTQASRVILSSAISDHWKEKVMPTYALRMGRQSLMLTACFAFLTGIVGGLVLIMDRLVPGTALFIASGPGLVFSFFISILYYQARRHIVRAG